MLIKVKVIPNSSKNKIVEQAGNFMRIKIKAVPEKGKANKELINFLAKHFNIAKSSVVIKSGKKKKEKYIEIKLHHNFL